MLPVRTLAYILPAALLWSSVAEANGRFPASVNVRTSPSQNDTVLLPSTFGLLMSQDGGDSFYWVCEESVGYGGTYDPDYAVAADGAIFATTFTGLRVSRDAGCSWIEVAALADQWVGEVEVAPNGDVWAATSSGGQPNDIYKSTDNGVTFVSQGMLTTNGWWKSVRVAPTDSQRVYITGYVVDNGMGQPEAALWVSEDAGSNWTQLDTIGGQFQFGNQPQLMLLAVSPTDPNIVFARAVGALDPGDRIYRGVYDPMSDTATWTEVLTMADPVRSFVVRSDGNTVIAGTVMAGVQISVDGGLTWNPTTEQPQMACLGERGDGLLLSCGANWAPDNFALATSTDGQTWTGIHRFQQIAGPLACDPGTIQADTCTAQLYPSLCQQLGIEGCEVATPDAGTATADATIDPPKDPNGGCCSLAGDRDLGGTAALTVLVLAVFGFGRRRRRR